MEVHDEDNIYLINIHEVDMILIEILQVTGDVLIGK